MILTIQCVRCKKDIPFSPGALCDDNTPEERERGEPSHGGCRAIVKAEDDALQAARAAKIGCAPHEVTPDLIAAHADKLSAEEIGPLSLHVANVRATKAEAARVEAEAKAAEAARVEAARVEAEAKAAETPADEKPAENTDGGQ